MRITITIELDEVRTEAIVEEYWVERRGSIERQAASGKERPSFPIFETWFAALVKGSVEDLTSPYGGSLNVRTNLINLSGEELDRIAKRAREGLA